MKRLLIDLTDMQAWSGTHGGTQRVVYGITKNFFAGGERSGYEVQFMAFSDANKRFHQTSFAPIYERVEAAKAAQTQVAGNPAISRKVWLKQRLRPYVPESVRRSPSARKLALKSFSIASRSSRKAKTLTARLRAKTPASSGDNVSFKKDDVVLVLGKPWDNLNIQETLSAEKQRINFKLVQLVYDMIIPLHPELHHPDLFLPYTQHMFEAIAASDLLLPISESTARDVKAFCKQLNLSCPEMAKIRLGDEVDDSDGVKPDNRLAEDFIACVGTIEIRKNHSLLYYSYKLAAKKGIDLPQLVIVGSRGWLSGDFQYLVAHDKQIKDKIIILDNVSDAGLKWIYDNALFTVYPSFYEGWGLPVAESLARGKPCIASDTSSIPEIAGQLLDYFSPYDSQQCLDLMSKYQDKAFLKIKQEEVISGYKITSWEQTFNQVLQAINKLDS